MPEWRSGADIAPKIANTIAKALYDEDHDMLTRRKNPCCMVAWALDARQLYWQLKIRLSFEDFTKATRLLDLRLCSTSKTAICKAADLAKVVDEIKVTSLVIAVWGCVLNNDMDCILIQ